jgi:hypothetical protein
MASDPFAGIDREIQEFRGVHLSVQHEMLKRIPVADPAAFAASQRGIAAALDSEVVQNALEPVLDIAQELKEQEKAGEASPGTAKQFAASVAQAIQPGAQEAADRLVQELNQQESLMALAAALDDASKSGK